MKMTLPAARPYEAIALSAGIPYATVPGWFGANTHSLKMDIMCPKNHIDHAPCPTIVWICGGAFMSVDRSVWLPELVPFAKAGYVVASIEYRLSSEAAFPAPLMDCKAAIRYLRAHAADFCIDPDRIYVMGESAGGCLATLVGVTGGMKEFESGDWLDYSSRVQGVIDFYGLEEIASELSPREAGALPYWCMEAFVGACYTPEEAAKASAISYVTADNAANIPPIMILHGTADATVPISQSRNFYAALEAVGVRSDYLEVEGAAHGDDAFYQKEILDRIMNFLHTCDKEA